MAGVGSDEGVEMNVQKKRPSKVREATGRTWQATFLYPAEDGTVEEAGFEFANALTEKYAKDWWKELLERAKAQTCRKAMELLKP